jgi:hypothetical protein
LNGLELEKADTKKYDYNRWLSLKDLFTRKGSAMRNYLGCNQSGPGRMPDYSHGKPAVSFKWQNTR